MQCIIKYCNSSLCAWSWRRTAIFPSGLVRSECTQAVQCMGSQPICCILEVSACSANAQDCHTYSWVFLDINLCKRSLGALQTHMEQKLAPLRNICHAKHTLYGCSACTLSLYSLCSWSTQRAASFLIQWPDTEPCRCSSWSAGLLGWLPSAKVKETQRWNMRSSADTQEYRRAEAHELWYNKPMGSFLLNFPLRPPVLHLCHYLLFLWLLAYPILFSQISSPSHLTVPSCVPLLIPSYILCVYCLFLSGVGNQAVHLISAR